MKVRIADCKVGDIVKWRNTYKILEIKPLGYSVRFRLAPMADLGYFDLNHWYEYVSDSTVELINGTGKAPCFDSDCECVFNGFCS